MTAIRIELPHHLRTLAGVGEEVRLEVSEAPTPQCVLDALEAVYPVLRGTIRDHETGRRRAYLRYFAAGEDISHQSPDAPLPEAVTSGADTFRILGAISGG